MVGRDFKEGAPLNTQAGKGKERGGQKKKKKITRKKKE